MELLVLDPWGDYDTAGYLRNHYQEKDLSVVGRLETAAFEQEVPQVLRVLRRLPILTYQPSQLELASNYAKANPQRRRRRRRELPRALSRTPQRR